MITRTIRQYLVCPYCKQKQDACAKDFFAGESEITTDIQCVECDQKFNICRLNGLVKTFSNALQPDVVLAHWSEYSIGELMEEIAANPEEFPSEVAYLV